MENSTLDIVQAEPIDIIPPKTICACNITLYEPRINPDSHYIIFLDNLIQEPSNTNQIEYPIVIQDTKPIYCYYIKKYVCTTVIVCSLVVLIITGLTINSRI